MEEKQYEESEPKDLFSKFRCSSIFPDSVKPDVQELLCETLKHNIVEDLAFVLFEKRMGFKLKPNLTPEEKKSITDTDAFKYYLDEAEKIYEKKLKAKHKKKYPVIEVPASGESQWIGGAYCLCFVYSKYDGNFVIKGYGKEVDEYLKKNHTHYFYNKSLWFNGLNRDIWGFWKNDIGIFRPSVREKRKGNKIVVREYSNWINDDDEKDKHIFEFKRMPKRWIPEFDLF